MTGTSGSVAQVRWQEPRDILRTRGILISNTRKPDGNVTIFSDAQVPNQLVLFRIGTLIPSAAGLLVQQQASNGSEQLLRLKA